MAAYAADRLERSATLFGSKVSASVKAAMAPLWSFLANAEFPKHAQRTGAQGNAAHSSDTARAHHAVIAEGAPTDCASIIRVDRPSRIVAAKS